MPVLDAVASPEPTFLRLPSVRDFSERGDVRLGALTLAPAHRDHGPVGIGATAERVEFFIVAAREPGTLWRHVVHVSRGHRPLREEVLLPRTARRPDPIGFAIADDQQQCSGTIRGGDISVSQ